MQKIKQQNLEESLTSIESFYLLYENCQIENIMN